MRGKRVANTAIIILFIMVMFGVCKKFEHFSAEETEWSISEKIPDIIEEKRKVFYPAEIMAGHIRVTKNLAKANIPGYTLMRASGKLWYEHDEDYLVERKTAGHGVFVSEHMSENEIFIGQILMETLTERGKVKEEYKPYFTDWALQQIENTDWSLLDEEWAVNTELYDRYFRLNHLLAGENYDFYYSFYVDKGKITKENTQKADIVLTVNSSGQIYGIDVEIHEITTKTAGIEYVTNKTGLFDDTCCEAVIRDGCVYEGKITLDFLEYYASFSDSYEIKTLACGGVLSSNDAAVGASVIGNMWVDVLESKGACALRYEDLFHFDMNFSEFLNNDWGQLEDNWQAGGYDCYYIDRIPKTGYAGFQFYFYPDFGAMETDTAKAVMVECNVNFRGWISFADVRVFSMTKTEYEERNGKQETQAKEETEPYVFSVRNLEEVRLDGTKAGDFYITNIGNHWNLYYINSKKQLYCAGGEKDELIAEHVVHVDCCRKGNTAVFLTEDGRLYGIGWGENGILQTEDESECFETPKLLMEQVQYAVCGTDHIVVLKEDGSVWTWGNVVSLSGYSVTKETEPVKVLEHAVLIAGKGDSNAALLEDGTVWTWGENSYNQCGIAGEKGTRTPVCVAQDAEAIWMGKLQLNDTCMDAEKYRTYKYDLGYCDNLVIRKKDNSLWACGKNIEGTGESAEKEEDIYTYEFHVCEITESNMTYDGMNTYLPVLSEYERAWKDENYTWEDWTYADASYTAYIGKENYRLYYDLIDLADDNIKELVIGVWNEKEKACSAMAVYSYDEGMIIPVWRYMDMRMDLYKQGILRSTYGEDEYLYYTYYQLQKNSGLIQNLANVTEEGNRLFINQMSTIKPIWKELEGFTEGENKE